MKGIARTKAAEEWAVSHEGKMVNCPFVIPELCIDNPDWGWSCPHARTHEANLQCFQGVCPIYCHKLSCEELS